MSTHRLQSSTNELGVGFSYTHNDLGQLLRVDVDYSNAPSHVTGTTTRHYRYGFEYDHPSHVDPLFVIGASQVATTLTGAAWETIVRRRYDSRQDIVREEIQVPDCGLSPNLAVTTFDYNDIGHRTDLVYPGTSGSTLRRKYRPDGVLEKVQVFEGSNYHTIASHLHEGEKVVQSLGYKVNPLTLVEEDPADLLYTKVTTLNGHGMPAQMHLDGALFDEFLYNWEGLVVRKYQHVEDQWTHIRYDDQNRMVDALWGSDSNIAPTDWSNVGASAGTTYIHRTQSWNEFGEISGHTELWKERATTTSVVLQRDNAGHVTGYGAAPDNQRWTQLLDGPSGRERLENFTRNPDAANLAPQTTYDFLKTYDCPSPTYLEDSAVEHLTTYDAWGNPIAETHDKTPVAFPPSIDCSSNPIVASSVSVSNLWDGYGRKVYYDLDGGDDPREVIIAYEERLILSSLRIDASGCGLGANGKFHWANPHTSPDRRNAQPAGDVCGGSSAPHAYVMVGDLSGRAVLSSRPSSGGIPETENANWNSVSRTAWGTIVGTTFNDTLVATAYGFGNWLMSEYGGPSECAMLPEQPTIMCQYGPDQPFVNDGGGSVASNGGATGQSGDGEPGQACIPEDPPCNKDLIKARVKEAKIADKAAREANSRIGDFYRDWKKSKPWWDFGRGKGQKWDDWAESHLEASQVERIAVQSFLDLQAAIRACLKLCPGLMDDYRRARSARNRHHSSAQDNVDKWEELFTHSSRMVQVGAFALSDTADLIASLLDGRALLKPGNLKKLLGELRDARNNIRSVFGGRGGARISSSWPKGVGPDQLGEAMDLDDIKKFGDPSKWKPKGPKKGSGAPAHSPAAPPGTKKQYEVFEDEFGNEIEVHYFEDLTGGTSNITIVPSSP